MEKSLAEKHKSRESEHALGDKTDHDDVSDARYVRIIKQQLLVLHRDRSSMSQRATTQLKRQIKMLQFASRERNELLKDHLVASAFEPHDEQMKTELQEMVGRYDDTVQEKADLLAQLWDVREVTKGVEKEIEGSLRKETDKKRQAKRPLPRREDEVSRRLLHESKNYSCALLEIKDLRHEESELRAVLDSKKAELKKLTNETQRLGSKIVRTTEDALNTYHNLMIAFSSGNALKNDLREAFENYETDVNTLQTQIKLAKSNDEFVHRKTYVRLPSIPTRPKPSATEEYGAMKSGNMARLRLIRKAFNDELKAADERRQQQNFQRDLAAMKKRMAMSRGSIPSSRRPPRHFLAGFLPARAASIVGSPLSAKITLRLKNLALQVTRADAVLSKDDLEVIQKSFYSMVATNDSLRHLVQERLDNVTHMQNDRAHLWEDIEALKNLRERQFQARRNLSHRKQTLQSVSETPVKLQEHLQEADEVLNGYLVAVEWLLKKLQVPEEELKKLYGLYRVIHERNLVDCLGYVEEKLINLEQRERNHEMGAMELDRKVFPLPPRVRRFSHALSPVAVPHLPSAKEDSESEDNTTIEDDVFDDVELKSEGTSEAALKASVPSA